MFTSEDLNTLRSDLLLQLTGSKEKSYCEENSRDTLEDFLHKNLNAKAKAYIYERDCPFLSRDTLKAYFGDVAFVQHTASADPGTFNVRFVANCTEDKMRYLVSEYDRGDRAKHYASRIMRLGLLRNFFSETFEPFHETMNRILTMNPVKEWMKTALAEKPAKESPRDLVLSFANGMLIAIL